MTSNAASTKASKPADKAVDKSKSKQNKLQHVFGNFNEPSTEDPPAKIELVKSIDNLFKDIVEKEDYYQMEMWG